MQSEKEPCPNQVASKVKAQDKLVEELKAEWKLLWEERFDDKVRAEGVSTNEYQTISIERGVIIHATRDCKPLIFKEILKEKQIENPERYIPPDVNIGGWNKFIKTNITSNTPQKGKRAAAYKAENTAKKNPNQQPKKGGRGWLHK